MKTLMQLKFEEVLNKTDVVFRKDTKPKPTMTHKGRHALHPYKGIVEFPASQGGGTVWLKSDHALHSYEEKGWKVVWL